MNQLQSGLLGFATGVSIVLLYEIAYHLWFELKLRREKKRDEEL